MLKPDKISPPKGYSNDIVVIKGAEFITVSELKRKMEEWFDKHQGGNSSLSFEVISIELSDEDKLKAEKAVVFEKALH